MHAQREGATITASLRLVRRLGAGGMGQVWVAWHDGLRCEVVVKLITDQLATSAEAVARFSREAAAASQVRSPHVVQVFDHGVTAQGLPYIAMELLEGESLRQRLDRLGALPAGDVTTIVAQCCKALSKAHERGVVHRDIKPDNVFLTDAGGGEIFVKLLDFGIAKATGGDMVATNTGAVLGSPYYMSPEQVMGSKSIDHRSDLWSLGVMTVEALTGRRPYEGETIGALSIAICHGEPPVPSRLAAGLPPEFDAWFARACARDSAARFVSAKDLADALAVAMAARPTLTASRSSADALAATAPLSTTAGLGLGTVQSSPSPAWQKWAIVGGIVMLGALGGIAAWSFSSSSTSAQPAGTPEPVTALPQPKPASTPASVPVETPVVSSLGVAPESSPRVKVATPTTAAPKKASQNASAAPSAQPAPAAPVPSSTLKSPPKIDNDPNLF